MTTNNSPWDDPEAQAWVRHALDSLGPMIADSACTVSLVPRRGTDVKFAVELGFSIMYDKPIILAVLPGVEIPDHLRRVADEIVDLSGSDGQRRLAEAVARVAGV